jgi:hypothetical protein
MDEQRLPGVMPVVPCGARRDRGRRRCMPISLDGPTGTFQEGDGELAW